MIDPLPSEIEAMSYAGEQAGEYLESLGKTDLSKMSVEEWSTLINVVCSSYVDRLGEIIGRIEADAQYLRGKIEPLPA
jgi:hypothetical protein